MRVDDILVAVTDDVGPFENIFLKVVVLKGNWLKLKDLKGLFCKMKFATWLT